MNEEKTIGIQMTLADANVEYSAFVEKFKPKKTTDDCYTPELVYDAVAEWVSREYDIDPARFVRPFWPGGDYERFEYALDSVVCDNPPFSILAEIVRFYIGRGIDFFLFAPNLTCLSNLSVDGVKAICTGAKVIYENGAIVNTSFLTSLGDPDIVAMSAPELRKAVEEASEKAREEQVKKLPKYSYPPNVMMATNFNYLSKNGVRFALRRSESTRIDALDTQRSVGKGCFGYAFLISERAAAERAAAERAAAERAAAERAAAEKEDFTEWQLSEREKKIIRMLDDGSSREEEQRC